MTRVRLLSLSLLLADFSVKALPEVTVDGLSGLKARAKLSIRPPALLSSHSFSHSLT